MDDYFESTDSHEAFERIRELTIYWRLLKRMLMINNWTPINLPRFDVLFGVLKIRKNVSVPFSTYYKKFN